MSAWNASSTWGWAFGACVVLAVVTALVSALVEGAAHAAERQRLWRAVADPAATRPPRELRQRYAERHSPRLAQVLAALAGLGVVIGPAILILGAGGMGEVASLYSSAEEIFADLMPVAAATLAASPLLLLTALLWNAAANVRGQDLRNALMRRWPTRPPLRQDSEGHVSPARTGPALTPSGGGASPSAHDLAE